MNWSSLISYATDNLGPGILLGIGIGAAALDWLFRRPERRALLEEKEQLIKKEKALEEMLKGDKSIKLVEIWMASNQKLVESNNRLEKSNERLQRYGDRMQKDMQRQMNDLKQKLTVTTEKLNMTTQVMSSLVVILERFTPLFPQVSEDENETKEWISILKQARSLNG